MTDQIDGGRLVARTLAASGVTHLFCLQGGHIDPILFGCVDEGIRVVDTRHEQAAAHMAEGWSRATGATVVLVEGDGAFGLNAMEFDTAVRHDIPIVCLVANDGSWGMSRHGQLSRHPDRTVATELGVRPYHEVVRALGGFGEQVDDIDELEPAIDRALASGRPACVDVTIDRDVVSPWAQIMHESGVE